MEPVGAETEALERATELTVAWLSNPNTRAGVDDVPAFLSQIHEALGRLSEPEQAVELPPASAAPAVSVRKSLRSKDHIISMLDGKPYKTLRRHLARHGLTPEQYRERFGLRPDYPMVSENYSQVRRDMAKRIGLGRLARTDSSDTAATTKTGETPKPSRGGRRKKVEA